MPLVLFLALNTLYLGYLKNSSTTGSVFRLFAAKRVFTNSLGAEAPARCGRDRLQPTKTAAALQPLRMLRITRKVQRLRRLQSILARLGASNQAGQTLGQSARLQAYAALKIGPIKTCAWV